jgi:hypothetical protein
MKEDGMKVFIWHLDDEWYWSIILAGNKVTGKSFTRKSSAKRGFLRWSDRALRELDNSLYAGNVEWVD